MAEMERRRQERCGGEEVAYIMGLEWGEGK